MKAYFITATLILAFLACKSIKDKSKTEICYDYGFSQAVEKVSLTDIKRIKQLEGKFIEVEGIFRYAFEDVALYPSKTAAPPEGMWLDLRVPDSLLHKLSDRKVIITGKVNLRDKGHYNGYIGTLDSAFCIKEK